MAEWSKALASGASPQGRGFEPHSCHFAAPPSLLDTALEQRLLHGWLTTLKRRAAPGAQACAELRTRAAHAGESSDMLVCRAHCVHATYVMCGATAKTLCPSGLRGWTQVPLARAAWVQIPQVSLHGNQNFPPISGANTPVTQQAGTVVQRPRSHSAVNIGSVARCDVNVVCGF